MTWREVSSTHFPNLASTLLADHTVVAFTPATSDFPWAADVTWEAARAVARTGRQVGLVDLCLEQPVLHRRAKGAIDEGIVDAFLFGVSLGHVAREQESSFHFIGGGTTPSRADDVYAHERWRRLGRGFKHEGALLLLFLPPSAFGRINADIDGIVVLSPSGYAIDAPTFPGIRDRLESGVPLLAVVHQGRRSGVTSVLRPPARRPRRRPARKVVITVSLAAVSVAALGVALTRLSVAPSPTSEVRAPDSTNLRSVQPETNGPSQDAAARRDQGDSLFYSVQVAAFNQADQAAAYARGLARAGAATVSPVRLGRQGVWYRVVVGALPTPAAADSLLHWLWSRRLVERPNGTILRTPHAQAVAEGVSLNEAGRLAEGLRRRGVAAYIVPAPGGAAAVLVGAFEERDQARAADSLLKVAGLKSTLVLRMGTRP